MIKVIKHKNYWKNIIEEWQREKPPVASFCRERQIQPSSFYYWRERFIPQNTLNKQLPKADFVPIEVCAEPHSIIGMVFVYGLNA